MQVKLPKSVKTVFAVTSPVIFSSNLRDGYLGLYFYFTKICGYFNYYLHCFCLFPFLAKFYELIIVLPHLLPCQSPYLIS